MSAGRSPAAPWLAPRRAARGAVLSVVGILGCWRVAAAQTGPWAVSPPNPTVGDTVWLARQVTVPAGWRVRAGKFEATDEIGSLGDPAVLQAPDGWVIRYPVVVWVPGTRTIRLPPVWRLAPDGRTDSLPGGMARLDVRSVIPDSITRPEPRSAIAPLRSERRNPAALVVVIAASAVLLIGTIAWRRRPSRVVPPVPPAPLEGEVPDARWLAAGEPKAVAARAAGWLRIAIARAHPRASPALSTAECLAILEHEVPDIPLRQVADVLTQLERVAFASAHGADVAVLAERARALARELAP
jgi:hypothetical protein